MIELHLQKLCHGAAGPLRLDLQLRVAPGAFVSLYGASGAGKTTLLRMLAGLTAPDHGRIVVDGVSWYDSARRIALPPQQRCTGYVFQDYALFPNLSVRDNVGYALGKPQAAQLARLLEIAGLSALQQRLPASLSGGQKQRVALARALARVSSGQPRLLLLDEPLSALDADLRSQLQDELLYLHREYGLTTILVSHDVGEVFKLSQQVHLLEQGRITRSGSPAQVFLQQQVQGKLNLQAQVLAVRREEVVYILSLLVGQDIVEIIADEEEVAGLKAGDRIAISAKAFSPLIFRQTNQRS
ncbi:MAG: ABC transporter ATP-binding protein [Burkholderiales bacterium]|nr:ABC transporter ATP-binding protein [Burkholderiales bacterium]